MKTRAKTSFKKWQVLPLLTLTPALSRWERENRIQSHDKTERGVCRTTAEQLRNVRPLFPLPQGEGQGENSPKNSRFEPLNPVGTRSTASPSFHPEAWDAGGTRPYQIQTEGQGEGGLYTNRSAKFTPKRP
jgi:hypothetical protein